MVSLKNLKVATRLGIGSGFVLVLASAIGGLGITRLADINTKSEQMIEVDVKKLDLALQIEAHARGTATGLLELVTDDDKAHWPKLKARIEAERKTSAEATDKLEALVVLPEGKAIVAKIKESHAPYRTSFDKVAALVEQGKAEAAATLFKTETSDLLHKYLDSVDAMADFQHKLLDKKVEENHHVYESSRNLLAAILGFALLIGVAFAWFVARSITRPLGEAVAVARRVAEGDLTTHVEVRSKDETGLLLQALKDMNQSLSGIVAEVRGGTDLISTASKQIAAGNADLSQRTEEQASSLEETASSMEELTSTVRQSAENARQANQLASGASSIAVKGGEVVAQVVTTMSGISESSKKIADIIGVIDGIAFQTNILALNAAVEAARAGEQGRGFAVVASEVRTLAQRSAAAAKEIKELITDSVQKVEGGTQLVSEAGKTMEEIVGAVKRVTDIMAEISAASQEQSSGIEQVNQAVMQMDQVTQQNAALVEEAAAAADSMQQQSQALSTAVSVFKVPQGAQSPAVRLEQDAVTQSKGNGEGTVRPERDAVTQSKGNGVERRGPNRAKNVARLPQKAEPKASAPAAVEPRKTGTDNDWSEF